MPPMLHVAFLELTARAQQQLLTHEMRCGVYQRHHILQLIPEPEGATGLIVPATRPETTGKRLIDEPAIGEHIERLIRCFYMQGSQRVGPMSPHGLKRGATCHRSSKSA